MNAGSPPEMTAARRGGESDPTGRPGGDRGGGVAGWPARRKLAVLAAAVLAVVGGLSGWLVSSGSSSPTAPLTPGRAAPGFSLPALEPGAPPVSLAELKGHPVVLNFFASWCPPCRGELPTFAAESRRVPGVRFVGVDVGDSTAGARSLVAQSGVTYPIGVDGGYQVAGGTYQLFGMPTTVFIDSSGNVAGSVTGTVGKARLERWIVRITQR